MALALLSQRKTVKRLFLILAALAVSAETFAATIDVRGAATITPACTNVSISKTILAANSNRVLWAISTTAGAATIYWKGGTGATVGGASSMPLAGGGSFPDRGESGTVYIGAISAVASIGTARVCTVEIVR